MANLKDLIVNGAARIIGKTYSSEFVGKLTGNATTATTADKTAHSLSIVDGASTPVAAIDGWKGSTDKTLTIKGESPVTTTATDGTITITHATSGATAGTYKSVTVDARGHVTAGTNPSTLSGYGITDAKIANGVITLGSNTITPLTANSTLAASKVSGVLATDNIPNLDAAKITSGTIDIERHPAYTAQSSGLYKITVDGTGHVSAVASVAKDDITALGIPGEDTTNVSSNTTGSGNAVTSVTASGSTITVTKGATFLTSHQDVSGKEDKSNKVTSWSSTATDEHYPSEKLVKTALDGINTVIGNINSILDNINGEVV